MKKLPSLSKTEFLIVDLLVRRREMYGLEMVKEDARLKRGTIYVLLDRLEEKGFVRSKQVSEPGVSGLPRRVYSITGTGARAQAAFQAAAAVFDLGPDLPESA
ncbi:MAG TPA: helix-turn-helix transcriptional regulator [Hyphomonadaceae bacterium]|nr:helix-turn-helix transcriptional regulator [Hyphomonadaceae bacterium]